MKIKKHEFRTSRQLESRSKLLEIKDAPTLRDFDSGFIIDLLESGIKLRETPIAEQARQILSAGKAKDLNKQQ